jgi:hypothetical protein
MLRIYPVILTFLRGVTPIIGNIERPDRDLARQLRRCGSSSLSMRRKPTGHGEGRDESGI